MSEFEQNITTKKLDLNKLPSMSFSERCHFVSLDISYKR